MATNKTVPTHASEQISVRLLSGVFKHALELDRAYILTLDPDRLLRNFRDNAGIASTAVPLGGWEAPECELRGHFVGHYLTACARMYTAIRDDALKSRARYLVRELEKCQKENGYLSAFPESFIDRVEAGERVWAPYYTLHKVFAGLLDAWTLLDDRVALDVVCKMADWAVTRCNRLTEEEMQNMLSCEHGGMNETLIDLYNATGEERYLNLSLRFNHRAVLDPLIQGEDQLTGMHANTQIPKLIGAALQYEITGDQQLLKAAKFFWETVTTNRSYVNGGNSDCERFTPYDNLSKHLSPETSETCNTYNMLKLTEILFRHEPLEKYAAYMERALFNHILASQSPETGMMCYYVPLRAASRKIFNDPFNSFWCCTGTGIENHAKYGDYIFAYGVSPTDVHCRTLYINQFIASEFYCYNAGISIRQETRFPQEAAAALFIGCMSPTEFELAIRWPVWAGKGYQVLVNGVVQENAEAAPGGYFRIKRTWYVGDRVEVSLPMKIRTEAFPDDPSRFAFFYGPILLCGVSGSSLTDVAVVAPGNPGESVRDIAVTMLECAESTSQIRFAATRSLFRSTLNGETRPVSLVPFYTVADAHYTVYWDGYSEFEWGAVRRETVAELLEQARIDQRTIDVVFPHRDRSELDHKVASTCSYSGEFGEWSYRDARDGGFFSYTLKSDPTKPLSLMVSYWGSDFGRTFDILVDGEYVATESLQSKAPDRLYDAVYPLKRELTAGKTQLTVVVQAPAKGMAGPVFGVRLLWNVA